MAGRAQKRLQDAVLRRRGLARGLDGELVVDGTEVIKGQKSTVKDEDKTTLMKVLEMHFQEPIEELISDRYSLGAVAKRLGVTEGCVSKWRLRFGIREMLHPKGVIKRKKKVKS